MGRRSIEQTRAAEKSGEVSRGAGLDDDRLVNFGGLVTSGSEVFVPGFCEGANELWHSSASDFEFGAGNLTPGMDNCAALALRLEFHPLNDRNAQGAIDPAHLLGRRAGNDHMVDDGFYGTQQFDKKTASDLPRPAFIPAKVAVDISERVPPGPIGEDAPGSIGPGFRNDRVLK